MASTYPVISVGQRLTADLLTSMMWQYVQPAASQSTPTSSTTLQTDTELVTDSLGVGTWEIDFNVLFTSSTAVKTRWAVTGTMSGNRRASGAGLTVAAVDQTDITTHHNASGFTTDIVYGYRSGSTQFWVRELATVVVTGAGTITFQFGQNVSNATATVRIAASYLKYKQIA